MLHAAYIEADAHFAGTQVHGVQRERLLGYLLLVSKKKSATGKESSQTSFVTTSQRLPLHDIGHQK